MASLQIITKDGTQLVPMESIDRVSIVDGNTEMTLYVRPNIDIDNLRTLNSEPTSEITSIEMNNVGTSPQQPTEDAVVEPKSTSDIVNDLFEELQPKTEPVTVKTETNVKSSDNVVKVAPKKIKVEDIPPTPTPKPSPDFAKSRESHTVPKRITVREHTQ